MFEAKEKKKKSLQSEGEDQTNYLNIYKTKKVFTYLQDKELPDSGRRSDSEAQAITYLQTPLLRRYFKWPPGPAATRVLHPAPQATFWLGADREGETALSLNYRLIYLNIFFGSSLMFWLSC